MLRRGLIILLFLGDFFRTCSLLFTNPPLPVNFWLASSTDSDNTIILISSIFRHILNFFAGIVHNFNELSKNTACVYDAVAHMARSGLQRLDQVSQAVGLDPTSTRTDLGIHLAFPRVDALQGQIVWMKEGVNTMGEWMAIVRKVLTAVSLVLMVGIYLSFFFKH